MSSALRSFELRTLNVGSGSFWFCRGDLERSLAGSKIE